MKIISEGMIDARMIEDSSERREEALLANSVDSKDCEQHLYAREILEECNIPPCISARLFEAENTYREDSLTVAIAYVVLSKEIPSNIQDILIETMNDNALEILCLFGSNPHKKFD